MTTETEPQTTDTFTDAHGLRYIAGCPVPEPVWERHENLVAEWTAENAEKVRLMNEVVDLVEERDWLRDIVTAMVTARGAGR